MSRSGRSGSLPSLIALTVAAVTWVVSVVFGQQAVNIPLTHPAIRYGQTTNDPVAVLMRQPQALARLESAEPAHLLASLLVALSVPVESQIMVFSKGSAQSTLIGGSNPRALYFNDAVSVGWVRGGFIEIASQDPVQGTVFYVVQPGARPLVFHRPDERCLSCHFGPRTNGIPGMIEPLGHTTPLEERWGGWYVTGRLGPLVHFGNVDVAAFLKNPDARGPELVTLEKTFDTSGYLAPHSDVAALLVFEHQMQMINLLTRLGWETRVAMQEKRLDQRQPAIRERVAQVVDYMLFVGEAPIRSRIEGSTGFATQFSARGPHDPQGRSLYQLDLTRRLLRYPASYMIYSEQFRQLPEAARSAIYQRLWVVLSGREKDPRYHHLSLADRQAIVGILRATKSDLPSSFRAVER